jgi:hypothetical protein
MGLAVARGLALALGFPCRRLDADALARGAPGRVPLIDAKRRELFVEQDGEIVALPAAVRAPGATCVGDGAVRYREHLERTGAYVPPDDASCTFRARASTRSSRATSAGRAVEPSTFARPTPTDARVKTAVDIRRSRSATSTRSSDRARVVPDAVVALDVRRRAREAASICLGAFDGATRSSAT